MTAQPDLFDTEEPDAAFQPRFVLYARAHGRTAAAQFAHNRATFPHASAGPFMRWMHPLIAAYQREFPERSIIVDQDAFTAWMVERVDAMAAERAAA